MARKYLLRLMDLVFAVAAILLLIVFVLTKSKPVYEPIAMAPDTTLVKIIKGVPDPIPRRVDCAEWFASTNLKVGYLISYHKLHGVKQDGYIFTTESSLNVCRLSPGIYEFSIMTVRRRDCAPSAAARDTLLIHGTGTGIGEEPPPFVLFDPYPNPARDNLTVPFFLTNRAAIVVRLYDVLGREVKTVFVGTRHAGSGTVSCATDDLAPGVYFARLTCGSDTSTRKVVIVR